MRAGIIASTEAKRIKEPIFTLDLLAFPGLSGSPVIRKRTGHVVGVLTETTDAIRRFSGFSRAAVIKQLDLSQSIEMFPPVLLKEQQ
jgi:V8-like Glu-specific endopeptidase